MVCMGCDLGVKLPDQTLRLHRVNLAQKIEAVGLFS